MRVAVCCGELRCSVLKQWKHELEGLLSPRRQHTATHCTKHCNTLQHELEIFVGGRTVLGFVHQIQVLTRCSYIETRPVSRYQSNNNAKRSRRPCLSTNFRAQQDIATSRNVPSPAINPAKSCRDARFQRLTNSAAYSPRLLASPLPSPQTSPPLHPPHSAEYTPLGCLSPRGRRCRQEGERGSACERRGRTCRLRGRSCASQRANNPRYAVPSHPEDTSRRARTPFFRGHSAVPRGALGWGGVGPKDDVPGIRDVRRRCLLRVWGG